MFWKIDKLKIFITEVRKAKFEKKIDLFSFTLDKSN